mmetsp:Transcript_80082/g.235549  ORF Transcript_80082/g.235549 Transcript_80082/m.235549 type:complete len:374 (+) Transcript_80082:41-1162(+)
MSDTDGRMLPVQALEQWFERWEFKAKYLLCCSDLETRTVREIAGDRAEELLDMHLGYTEVRGSESLRKAIAKEYYTTMTEDDIMVFSGAEEAIYCAMSTVKQGDHIVCVTPAYQSLWACAKARGAEVCQVSLSESKGKWSLDMASLKEALKSRPTNFLVMNAPHNPTGWYPSSTEHEQIVSLCEQYQVSIFNDEVYRGLEWANANPAACDTSPKGVSLGVLSKAQGLAGLRLGWLATKDHGLLAQCTELKLYLSICTAGPSELLGEMAIAKNQSILSGNRELILKNMEIFKRFLVDNPGWFEWTPPPAGCISFPKVVNPKVTDVTTWCVELAEKGLMLMPGSVMSPEWEGYVRIGFGRKNFQDNLKVLATHLR